jgi:signal transduction histidine kinase/DNA-binding response OmpR family regulator
MSITILRGTAMFEERASPLLALLVEDEPADAELVSRHLESASSGRSSERIRLVSVGTTDAACALLRDIVVDAVILDLSLPDARGLEALRRICAITPDTPIIVLSGIADETIALEALRSGAQDYVLKPLGASMKRIVRFACERQRLLRALHASIKRSAESERKARMLSDIGTALAEAHDSATAMSAIAAFLVPSVADCCVLLLDTGTLVPATPATWHAEGEASAALLVRMRDLVGTAMRGSAPLANWRRLVEPVFTEHGLTVGALATIRFGDQDRGLLVLASAASRHDATIDDEFARAVADRATVSFEQHRLLRQMQLAVAARDRAVSIVSHDLRNPLSTIQICADALLNSPPAPLSAARNMALLIQRSATVMQQIAEDLLDRASLESGGFVLHRSPTAVAEMMDTVQFVFARIAAEQAIELVVRGRLDLPLVDVDSHRIVQALSNLMSNAVKFTPRGGRIDLSVSSGDAARDETLPGKNTAEVIRFTVSDTGPGIRPEDLSRVFDWFWQSPHGSSSGVGIGLSIAKGLVEAHSQRLHVESGLGRGSTFWFTVPVAVAALGGLVA